MPTPSPEVIAARKLNLTKYALQDFDEAVTNLSKAALLFGVLVLAMGLSLLFGAGNLPHLVFSILLVAGLLVVPSRIELLQVTNLIMLTAGYVGLLALEMMFWGLPDLLLPFLNVGEWRGFPVFLNELTPYLYYGIKLAAGGYIILLWLNREKVVSRPVEDLRKVAPERYQALGLV